MTAAAPQWVNGFDVKSESSSRLYRISQRAPGGPNEPWYCSCPIFVTGRQVESGRRTCKHLIGANKVGPPATPSRPVPVKVSKPRKSRSRFSDELYRHYDTSTGYGSPSEWYRAAEEAAFGPGYRSWTREQREQERRRAEAEREERRAERQARARAERERGRSRYAPPPPPPPRYGTFLAEDLRLLDLDELPDTVQELKRAMRLAAFRTHPDHGGSEAAFKAMFAAYERLLRRCQS